MAKAKTYGTGWHGQTVRHSNAKRLGRAGGNYATMTYTQLKAKGVNLKPNTDSDHDGVKNKDDCRPLNPKAQDDGMPAPTNMEIKQEEAKKKNFFQKAEEYIQARKKRREEQAEENRQRLFEQRAKEHEQRRKEIEQLKQEAQELKDQREVEAHIQNEKQELLKIKQERDSLKHAKRDKFLRETKEGLIKTGRFIKKEYKVYKKSQNKKRKGKKKEDSFFSF